MSIGPTSTDADLIAETRNGSHQAFRELVRRYEGTVAATVIGMLGPGSEAEDAGQDVMIRFYQSLDRFEGKSSLKTYITRIAVNQSIDVIRRRKRNRWRLWSSREDEPGIDVYADPRDRGREAENRRAVHQALQALPEEFRAVAVLRMMQGYSTQETADLLGVPLGTVLSRLSRAKAQLAELLKDEDHGPE